MLVLLLILSIINIILFILLINLTLPCKKLTSGLTDRQQQFINNNRDKLRDKDSYQLFKEQGIDPVQYSDIKHKK